MMTEQGLKTAQRSEKAQDWTKAEGWKKAMEQHSGCCYLWQCVQAAMPVQYSHWVT